jgi:2-phospho-L-lactate guanylyltransferase
MAASRGPRDLCVVLPVRGIGAGKTRLAGTLDAIERVRLNRYLLLRTLDVLGHWLGGLERCLVVSPCARALRLAAQQGAVALRQPHAHGGLNPALRLGVRHARQSGARRVLILPCDLPLVSVAALDALLAVERGEARVVLAPDCARTGTNALLLPAAHGFPLRFGADSFVLHRQAARARGWRLALCEHPALRFDLDTPQDLAVWRSAAAAGRGGRRWYSRSRRTAAETL